jgi:FkbM family methyltransferase
MTMAEICNLDLIFDTGAHIGEDTDFYLKLGYRVVAVEANPALADGLRQRFREAIADGRLILVDKAITETTGSTSFFVNHKDSVWGTADPQWAARNRILGADSEQITVNCIRFADLIDEYGCPHYLKIDVEGADMLCIDALKTSSCRPKFISLESTKTSWSDLLKEFDTFEALGYTKFKVVRQGRHKSGHFTAHDGRKFRYAFEPDASGPFGEDLGGRWIGRRQAILRYVPIFLVYKTIGDSTWLSRALRRISGVGHGLNFIVGWYDTHAMLGDVPTQHPKYPLAQHRNQP